MLNKEDETNNDSSLGTEQPDSSPVMKLSPDMGKDLDDPNSLWERSSFLCVAYTIDTVKVFTMNAMHGS